MGFLAAVTTLVRRRGSGRSAMSTTTSAWMLSSRLTLMVVKANIRLGTERRIVVLLATSAIGEPLRVASRLVGGERSVLEQVEPRLFEILSGDLEHALPVGRDQLLVLIVQVNQFIAMMGI